MDRINTIRSDLKNDSTACYSLIPPFSRGEKGGNPLSLWERVRVRGGIEMTSNKINADSAFLIRVNRVNRVNRVYCFSTRWIALALMLALAGCGMVNWSVSNSPDVCPKTQSTVPCP